MGSVADRSSISSDIAVVGLSCRFPGSASNPAKFWELLHQRKSAYTEVPKTRYNANAFYHPTDKLNTLSCTGGHFLEQDVSAFDAPFFSITAQEAKAMDPTARMLLEVTYEALENAGIPIESLVGSDTSCYVGCFTRDFHEMLMRDTETSPMYAGTGTGFSLLSNRLSWFYDFRGPSMTLDTACSSSLVGLHLACQGLRSGESKIAVVSGANLILSPDLAIFLSNLQMLSKEGLSRSFADGTSGYGRGEGIATVILKPVADALRDGDHIRAVIRGTGVNQDGHTTGITLPNSDAQADLIRSTYRSAGLHFSHTGYFEAHGTGTAVGDPLELSAVARTLGEVQQNGQKVLVGSVKSNIGHLEGAAGLAGVIKCILMLESATILPNIHFDRPNRRIPFDDWKISVPTSVIPWPSHKLQRASVNSFGYGGTNAHAILDSATEYLLGYGLGSSNPVSKLSQESQKRERLFVVSAQDEAALDRMRQGFSSHLETLATQIDTMHLPNESVYLDQLSFTLSERRSQFDWKAYAVASSIAELRDQLATTAAIQGARSSTTARIAFLFTGQGAQWPRMGVELLQFPVFKASLLQAERYLTDVLGCDWSVLEELQHDSMESKMQLAKISQPMCTILQVALVDLLASWNIKPSGAVGHSSGEIAAAYSYGAFSREDAWTIAYWRGKLCSELKTEAPDLKGSMMAVGLSREASQRYIETYTGKVVVACVNSPSSVTISGDDTAIDELNEKLKADSVFCRKLKVENAYHSHHMQRIAERYRDKLTSIQAKKPSSSDNMTFASSVTGQVAQHSDLGPEYWVRNLVSPVLFSDAVQALFTSSTQRRRRARATEAPFNVILEVGPHAALKGPLRQILEAKGIRNVNYASVIMRGEDAAKTAVGSAGTLYIHGAPVSILAVNDIRTRPKPLVDLPPYPWNHSRKYWSESSLSKNYRFREEGRHDLLGSLALGYNELEPKWRHFLRVKENPWIRDHVVHSTVLYPAAGILALPLEAMRQIADKDKVIEKIQLKDVHITKAIVVPDNDIGTETFLQLRRQRLGATHFSGWWEFTVFTRAEDQQPEENGFGLVTILYKSGAVDPWADQMNQKGQILRQEYLDSQKMCIHEISPVDFYNTTKQAGLDYGTSFQGLTDITIGRNRACCTIAIPDTQSTMPGNIEGEHLVHPTTLDIIFHSLFAALGEHGRLDFETAAIPVSFESLTIAGDLPSGAGAQFHGFCTAQRLGPREIVADICYSDAAWMEPKVQIKGLRCRELPGSDSSKSSSYKGPFGSLLWKPDIHFSTKVSLENYLSQVQPKRTRVGDVCSMLDLAAHKNPNLSILQVGGGISMTSSILSVLASGPQDTARFSKLLVADTSAADLQDFDTTFQAWETSFATTVLEEDIPLRQQKLEPASFDVIIIAVSFSQKHLTKFLNGIHELLLDGGLSLVLDSGDDAPDTAWEDWASISGLLPIGLFGETSPEALFALSKPYSSEASNSTSTVYILQPPNRADEVSELSQAVVRHLSNKSIESEVIPWPPESFDLMGKPIISLLELRDSMLASISSDDFERLKHVVLRCSSLLWVTKGNQPTTGAAMGYLRVLKNENPNLNLRYLRLEDRPNCGLTDLAAKISSVAIDSNIDREFTEIDGMISINRWMPDSEMNKVLLHEGSTASDVMILGESQSALELVTSAECYFTVGAELKGELPPDQVEVETKAISLSASYTQVSAKEFSGVVKAIGKDCHRLQIGDRVYSYDLGPHRSAYKVAESRCHRIPDDKPFENAATWSLTFATAHQSLTRIANLKPGETVLIQDASNGSGQAALQVALACNATIFATVKSELESGVVEKCGRVPKERILNDSDSDLAGTISRLTSGRGFDVILNNSQEGEGLQQLWHSIAPFGRLINTRAVDSLSRASLDIVPFQKGCSFSVVDLNLIAQNDPSGMADILKSFSKFLDKDSINGIEPLDIFAVGKVADAWSHIQKPRNLGKTILTFDQQSSIPIHPSASHSLMLRHDASYVLTGGLGGLGRSLARLLVDHGARHLVFISRSGLKSPQAAALVDELKALRCTTHIFACDISDEAGMRDVIAQCTNELPPIRGVIQSAAVLNDSIYDNMTHENWQRAVAPKIQGSWFLHELLPKDMDFFVMPSSIAGVVGNRSQANYATGNTFQDALARYRRDQGLPAVAVDLGLMLGIGFIAERGGFTNLRQSEAVGLNEAEFHAIMKAAMVGLYGTAVTPAQLVTGLPTGGILHRQGLDAPFYYDDPRFLFLRKLGLKQAIKETGGSEDPSSSGLNLATQFGQCKSMNDASRVVTTALSGLLAKALQTSADNIDSSKPLHSYGVDSLMAVEIRTWIMQQIKAEVTLFDVLSGTSILMLAGKIARSSKLVPSGLE